MSGSAALVRDGESMLERFVEFWSLRDPNVVWVLCGCLLLGTAAGVIGSFSFLRKRALTGDALAHAALPGVTTAFMLCQTRAPLVILTGALVSCALGWCAIELLTRGTRIKEDSALAIVLSFFFGVGIFQLSIIQRSGLPNQAGLDRILFGQAAALAAEDVQILILLAAAVLLVVAVFFSRFKAITFDPVFARAVGLNVRASEALLAATTVVAVVVGLQLVGVVLMAALLLTPPAAARYWTDDLRVMLTLAGLFGALAGVVGAMVSYLAPRMPTGPWMVVGVTLVFFLSLTCAPRRGALPRWFSRRAAARRVAEENLLRTMFRLAEDNGGCSAPVEATILLQYRSMGIRTLEATLERLMQQHLVVRLGTQYQLTAVGYERGKRLTRVHRLWELYLTRRINIASDHVHADAEEIEHLLTPELEARLLEELAAPAEDPHGRRIPGPGSE